MFPKVRNNPLRRIVTTGTITFNRYLRPRCVRCRGRMRGGTSMLTRTLVSHNFAVMSNNASGRSVLMSLHSGCPSLANGMTRGTLMTTSVAMGGGVMPFSDHSTFRASNVHLNAPTVAAHNTGRSLVLRVTRVVRAMLSGISGRRMVTRVHTHIGGAVRGCPVFTCWEPRCVGWWFAA